MSMTENTEEDKPSRRTVVEKVDVMLVSPVERGPRCETCRFYSGAHELEDNGTSRPTPHGQCRRMPPLAWADRREFAFWPKVLVDSWCEEHQATDDAD